MLQCLKMQFIRMGLLSSLYIPPPYTVAVQPLIVQLLMVGRLVFRLYIPAPYSAVLP